MGWQHFRNQITLPSLDCNKHNRAGFIGNGAGLDRNRNIKDIRDATETPLVKRGIVEIPLKPKAP